MNEEQFDPANEDADLRVHLSRLPRHDAPAKLMAQLRRDFIGPSWLDSLKAWFVWPTVWKPAGVLAAAALISGLWFTFQNNQGSAIELEPLLAAHTVTQADSLVPDSATQLAFYATN